MLLFALKKCALRAQMRQLLAHNKYNKNLTRMIEPHYSIELKCPYSMNPNFTIYKLIHTNPGSERQKIPVPRLIYYSVARFRYSIFKLLFSYCAVRLNIDKDFKWSAFMTGAMQAITVISNALAERNYEILNDMVQDRTLKVLKSRVDALTPQQLELLPINFDSTERFICNMAAIRQLKTADENQAIIDVYVVGTFCKKNSTNNTSESSIFESMSDPTLFFLYVFQRKYENGIGGSWMVKRVYYDDFARICKTYFSM